MSTQSPDQQGPDRQATVQPSPGRSGRRHVDLEVVRAQHKVVDVLARMGIDTPAEAGAAGGHRHFRVPAAALGLGHGRDDSQGVLIKPSEAKHCWWAFHDRVGGDVIALVQAATGTTLLDAVDLLEAGGPIAVNRDPGVKVDASGRVQARSSFYEDPDLDRTPVERVQAINAEAWRYYTLPQLADRARTYLAGRAIDVTALEETAGAPLAGHTPHSATGLVDQLRRRGFSDDEMVDSGWAARPREQTGDTPAPAELRDRFRDRVLLPFRDEEGQVVGVTGRSVDWTPESRAPKYLNHPRTATFDKSNALYRPLERPVSSKASAVVVEGTLDALAIAAAAATAGVVDHFAPLSQSGVSLTPQVLGRVAAITARPPIAVGDSDTAGRGATARWAEAMMTGLGREVLTVQLPEGLDPADWMTQRGREGLMAFSSWNCLDDADHLRPRPAGGVLALEALRAAREKHPDREVWELVDDVVDDLATRAATVRDPAALQRFAREAAAILVTVVDGRPAAMLAAAVEAKALTQVAQPTREATAAPAISATNGPSDNASAPVSRATTTPRGAGRRRSAAREAVVQEFDHPPPHRRYAPSLQLG